MSELFPAADTRELILRAIPERLFQSGRDPLPPDQLYVPHGHARCLDPDQILVSGIRGSGKTAWWQALLRPDLRMRVQRALPTANLNRVSVVSSGFGDARAQEHQDLSRWPDVSALRSLLTTGRDPLEIWRTVVLDQVAGLPLEAGVTWGRRVAWVAAHPEEASQLLIEADDILYEARGLHLILFDALDRTAERREDRQRLLRGLLRLALDIQGLRAVRIKVFLRPDMLDSVVAAFPDASKIQQDLVKLQWKDSDLFGLLFQRLANADDADDFRAGCRALSPTMRWEQGDGLWSPPSELRNKFESQRRLLDEIAGPWMGREARRGLPYTWLPNHLKDGLDQVSPRSFLRAVRTAAEDASRRYPSHPYALHYESIKRGVASASQIRVAEINEDYPWVKSLMTPLEGLKVPCDAEEVETAWNQHNVVGEIRHLLDQSPDGAEREFFSAPNRLDQGLPGLLQDLIDVGVMTRDRASGRLNMPDVYRVAYGVLRKGGVKPGRVDRE